MPAMTGICTYLDETGAVSTVAVYDRYGKPDRVTPQQYTSMGFQPRARPPAALRRPQGEPRQPELLTVPPDKSRGSGHPFRWA